MSAESPSERIGLTLIVPAFNEAARLSEGFGRLNDAVAAGALDPTDTEFLVVDDGSSDDTADRARQLLAAHPHVRVIRLEHNSGKGAAIRAGVAEARGDAIAFSDADMAVDPEQIPLLVGALDEADVAIGSRSLPDSSVDCDSVRRTVMGRTFNWIVNVTTNVSLGDTQCGFKAFRAPVAKILFHCSMVDRFAFDVDILYTARRLGLRIAEVPVRWRHVHGSRIRPVADPFSMVKDVLRARSGMRSPAPIAALQVGTDPTAGPATAPASALLDALRPLVANLPVLASGAGALVLFPLEPTSDVDRVEGLVAAALSDQPHRRRALSMDTLLAMAPLHLCETAPPLTAAPTGDGTSAGPGANGSGDGPRPTGAPVPGPTTGAAPKGGADHATRRATLPGQRAVAGF